MPRIATARRSAPVRGLRPLIPGAPPPIVAHAHGQDLMSDPSDHPTGLGPHPLNVAFGLLLVVGLHLLSRAGWSPAGFLFGP
jgi:hypothetical protein